MTDSVVNVALLLNASCCVVECVCLCVSVLTDILSC